MKIINGDIIKLAPEFDVVIHGCNCFHKMGAGVAKLIAKNFPEGVTELRYVRHAGQDIPNPSIKAEHYWLSPHSDGFTINTDNLKHCINLCIKNGQWKLSLQNHKIWNVL